MRTLGVDLSTDPAKTWACLVEWDASGARVVALRDRLGEDELLKEVREARADVVGVDCPLGWPEPFVRAVGLHAGGGRWPGRGHPRPEEFRRSLSLRVTDRWVKHETGRSALSVSADRLGATAMRCALVADALASGAGWRIDRTGRTGPLVEVYPRAALGAWLGSTTAYKGRAGGPGRDTILDALTAGSGVEVQPEHARKMRAGDDALDAFVCALVARAARAGATALPGPEAAEVAAREGWIEVPDGRTAQDELLRRAAQEGWIHVPGPGTLPRLAAQPGSIESAVALTASPGVGPPSRA